MGLIYKTIREEVFLENLKKKKFARFARKRALKISILDYLIAFSMFIKKTIIPIKKCSI